MNRIIFKVFFLTENRKLKVTPINPGGVSMASMENREPFCSDLSHSVPSIFVSAPLLINFTNTAFSRLIPHLQPRFWAFLRRKDSVLEDWLRSRWTGKNNPEDLVLNEKGSVSWQNVWKELTALLRSWLCFSLWFSCQLSTAHCGSKKSIYIHVCVHGACVVQHIVGELCSRFKPLSSLQRSSSLSSPRCLFLSEWSNRFTWSRRSSTPGAGRTCSCCLSRSNDTFRRLNTLTRSCSSGSLENSVTGR